MTARGEAIIVAGALRVTNPAAMRSYLATLPAPAVPPQSVRCPVCSQSLKGGPLTECVATPACRAEYLDLDAAHTRRQDW